MKIINEYFLDNGIKACITDHSKQIAGDRYFISVWCTLTIPQEMVLKLLHKDNDTSLNLESIHQDDFCLVMKRERNFIDVGDKEAIKQTLIDRIQDALEQYMSRPVFVENLVRKKLEEIRRNERVVQKNTPSTDVDEEGPADFSACFNV